MVLNPGRRRLKGGESGVFVAVSQAELDEALTRSFSRALHPASSSHLLDPELRRGPALVCLSPALGRSQHCRTALLSFTRHHFIF